MDVRIEDDGLGFYFIFFHFPLIFPYFLLKEYKIEKRDKAIEKREIELRERRQSVIPSQVT